MRKVLIIDGDKEFLEMASSFLEAANILVATADAAGQARTRISGFIPDLILLNRDLLNESGHMIPDGLEILREIKSDKKWKKIPVILLVNDASDHDLDNIRLLKYKADDYARKPIADNELLRRIENLIGFDPDETTSVLLDEKDNLSVEQILKSTTDNPEFEEAAQKEIQDLITRLGEEVVHTTMDSEAAEDEKGASPEQLLSEFNLLQEKLRGQEKRFGLIREKSRRAVQVLENRIAKLESENQVLGERLFASEASLKELIEDKIYLINLLEQARELLLRYDNLKKGLDRDAEKSQRLLRELEPFKK